MAVFTDSSGATISTMIPDYYNRLWLERFEANLVYEKFAQVGTIPKNEGDQMVWHQLKNVGQGYTLDEVTAAGTSAVSTRKASASLVWKAQLVDVTSRVDMTAVMPIVKETVAMMGYTAALTKDSFIAGEIGFNSAASTGVADAASATLPSANTAGFPLYDGNTDTLYWARTALQNGKFSTTPTIAHIRGAVTQLRNVDAIPFDDGLYRGIIHPSMSRYIRADSTFATWMAYTNRSAMERGKLGTIEQVMFEESSNATKAAVLASTWSGYVSGGTLYGTLIVGKGAYGVTKLNGADAKVSILQGADKSDPHNLHTYISYKFAVAATILNPSAGVILTTLIP